MGKIDLHVHSTASDGRFSPEEVVRKAAGLGLTILALADHDSVDGIVPAINAARAFPQLTFIPGVEISTDIAEGEVHVLGYFIDCTDPEFKSALYRFRDSRLGRAQGMIEKLKGLGVFIEWERVKEIAGPGSVGRPHIAQAMLEKGYISSLKEAFARYIGRNGPAYVEREKVTPAEAVAMIARTKGLPVLAHPFTAGNLDTLIPELKAAGLVGMEAYYGQYKVEEVLCLVSLAEKYGLITTGGSDYHGLDDSNETMLGAVDVPPESARRLIALAEQRKRAV
ncbi:MAG: PHP domain-containing protein [Dehalococcoidales bacterium]|nr:PHP domain-containing protein [Dehalococcoidales bacterium]